jgi:outer membrane protein assembly complex protein YaeT
MGGRFRTTGRQTRHPDGGCRPALTMRHLTRPVSFRRLFVAASRLGLILIGLSAARAEGAVDEYLGKPVASVILSIEGRETIEPSIARVVETRVGEPLSMSSVRDSILHLFSLGRFDDIRVDATLVNAGRVALRYELSPIHPVTKIDFTGLAAAPDIDTGQLRRAVIDRFGASPSLGRVEELTQLVNDLLVERGYLRADIRPRAEISHAPDRATLVFAIDPGAQTTIGTIDIDGTPTVPRAELLRRLDLMTGAPYRRDALNARIERYIADRRKAGYYEAKLTVTPMLADGDRTANLRLTVAPGKSVRLVFKGDPLPSEKREELVPVEREGSVDEDLLEDSTNRIEAGLRAEGYRDAKAPHTRSESGGELTVTFDIKRGPEFRVDGVEIVGNAAVPLSEIEPALRLRSGAPFSQASLEADLSTIEDLYHRRGFVAAKARPDEAARPVEANGSVVPLRVRILVSEGPRTVVTGVRVQGDTLGSEEVWKERLGLRPGGPYVDRQLLVDRDALQYQYLNLGYPTATVDADPGFSADRTAAVPTFTVHLGPRILVDHVLIVGNVRTSAATIERELQIKPGDPLSEAAKIESRRRLAALGLFRRVQITELAHGDEGKRDVLVTVEESLATSIVFGAGAEGRLRIIRSAADGGAATERLDVAPRGSFEISRRNVFGKNRSVSFFASGSVHLQNPDTFDENGTLTASGPAGITEYRALGTYREPRVFGSGADAIITGTFEQQARASFNFARRGASAEIARKITSQIGLSGSYQIQRTRVFDESVNPSDQLLVDRLFPQVRLSSVSSSIVRDTRDDLVDPGSGTYVSGNIQLAARRIGSEVGFAKTFLRAQVFRIVPGASRIVFAGNASIGMATGFPREVVVVDAEGQPSAQTVEDLPASERFFAGGDSGPVRGFSLDSLGTPATLDKDGFPIGGNAALIFNAELRATVRNNVQAVGFLDAGNVFARTSDLDLSAVRSAVGFGVRYKSPVGPIRVDLGFKMNREEIAGRREGLTALHISIGQAF